MQIKKMAALLFALILCVTLSHGVRVNAEEDISTLAACTHPYYTVSETSEPTPETYSHSHTVVVGVGVGGQMIYGECDVYHYYVVETRKCRKCNATFTKSIDKYRHSKPWADNNPYNP